MKFLMICSNQFKQPWPVIPFGACCVAESVRQNGHEVMVSDLCFSSDTVNDIYNAVNLFKPEVVGVSIRNIDDCVALGTKFLLADVKNRVIEPLKKIFSGPIIVGGPAVGISAREILEFLELSYAVHGDGEKTVTMFLEF